MLGLLLSFCGLCWVYSFRMAAQVEGSPHQHGGRWPLLLMWGTMMAAMMVPPEVPRLLLLMKAHGRRDPLLHAFVFLGGTLAPWMGASVLSTLLQERLAAAGLMTETMAVGSRSLGGGLLLAAGAMQLSPLKRACLKRCRFRAAMGMSPRDTPVESFHRGARHGAVSVGCCGLLMLVLFVTGVMNPLAMALLTGLLLLENVAPERWPVRWVTGALLLGWGASLFLL